MPTEQKKKAAIILFLLFVLVSCDRNRVYEENTAIPEGTWSSAERISFQADISDNTIPYNVFIIIRNGTDYPFSNLYLFLNTTFPDGKNSRDTIECMLADYDGRWLGSGSGSVKFNRFQLKKGVRFPLKGRYRFEFEQAMRVKDLKGIVDLGLRIER
jgi:gliding motility-associated lipoprotein GldH